jgi:predicted house-cleaning noncanonical NTP pyrophosphatase (MazG superfamily)
MTHEPIRVIHFSLHITWQGTQAELDAMLAEGWPMGSASEIIAACNRDAAEAEAYAAKLEAKLTEELRYWQADSAAAWDKCEEYRLKLAKVIPLLGRIKSHKVFSMEELADLIAELKGQDDA